MKASVFLLSLELALTPLSDYVYLPLPLLVFLLSVRHVHLYIYKLTGGRGGGACPRKLKVKNHGIFYF